MNGLLLGPDGTLRNGWKVALFLLAAYSFNGVALLLRPGLPWLAGHPAWFPPQWCTFLAVLAATGFSLSAEDRPLASVGLRLDRRWLAQLLAGILAGCALIGLMALAGYLAGGFHLVRNPAATPGALALGLWLFLAVACSEELLFRGYLFQRLEAGIGPWATQLALAVLFALLHWGNPGMAGATRVWASLNIALAGILLGLCYLRTRSLALPIGLHLAWNWTQGPLLGFGVSGNPSVGWWIPVGQRKAAWVTGGSFGLEASLACTLICAGACLALALIPPFTRPEK
jgi:hypothetical protein